jgi:hypothetical protein
MIRAALIALALTVPASAATTDLVMTIVDGRPLFRPADGLECYTAKFGGQAIPCMMTSIRPRRAPCWIRPDFGPCPVGAMTLAALPPQFSTFMRPGRNGYDSPFPHRPTIIGTVRHEHVTPPQIELPPVPAVPLPGSGALMAAIVVMAIWRRRSDIAQAESLPR